MHLVTWTAATSCPGRIAPAWHGGVATHSNTRPKPLRPPVRRRHNFAPRALIASCNRTSAMLLRLRFSLAAISSKNLQVRRADPECEYIALLRLAFRLLNHGANPSHNITVCQLLFSLLTDVFACVKVGDMANPTPLLILSDAVSSSTGLGRIARDLAVRVHENLGDVYRLGTVGYGAPGSAKFPWPQYCLEGMDSWVCPTLPDIIGRFCRRRSLYCHDYMGRSPSHLACCSKGSLGTVRQVSRPSAVGNEQAVRSLGLSANRFFWPQRQIDIPDHENAARL